LVVKKSRGRFTTAGKLVQAIDVGFGWPQLLLQVIEQQEAASIPGRSAQSLSGFGDVGAGREGLGELAAGRQKLQAAAGGTRRTFQAEDLIHGGLRILGQRDFIAPLRGAQAQAQAPGRSGSHRIALPRSRREAADPHRKRGKFRGDLPALGDVARNPGSTHRKPELPGKLRCSGCFIELAVCNRFGHFYHRLLSWLFILHAGKLLDEAPLCCDNRAAMKACYAALRH
jgi:hypothetical protein